MYASKAYPYTESRHRGGSTVRRHTRELWSEPSYNRKRGVRDSPAWVSPFFFVFFWLYTLPPQGSTLREAPLGGTLYFPRCRARHAAREVKCPP